MENHDEILAEFILEAREIIDRLDVDFVRLEENPNDQALVGTIFRGLHTLKGSSSFFSRSFDLAILKHGFLTY
jgi:two-component system chemotaxis sensor kinase CheA